MNIALIFAGGIGSRMGNEIPKQFLEWNGKAILIHTINVFDKNDGIDEIVVVCKEEWIDYTRSLIAKEGIRKVVSIVPGGDTAMASQYNGLKEIERLHGVQEILVLIHDGVRPLIDDETIEKIIACAAKNGNAVTVTKAIETVITVDESGIAQKILNRESCRMAKAPQCFRLSDIITGHLRAISEGKSFIDSASMMHYYGYRLNTVEGKMENIKVTTPSDYYMFLGITKSMNLEQDNL